LGNIFLIWQVLMREIFDLFDKSFFIYAFLHQTPSKFQYFFNSYRKSAVPGWGELQKQNSIQLQVFALVFYQLELCGEKSTH
jgi:hypothetical protein